MTTAKSKPLMPKATKPHAVQPEALKPKVSKPEAKSGDQPNAKAASRTKVTKPSVAAVRPGAKTVSSKKKNPKPGTSEPSAAPTTLAVAKPSVAPAKIKPIEQAVGVSSDAVARRTGKSWAQWFALLDAAGAAELDHKGIVAVLAQRHGVGPWWQQMVTVAYEKARGMREHQPSEEGFQAGVSKTLELPLAKLYRLWAEPAERNKWLGDDRFSIHKATASKSIRARWGRGVSRIDVDFCAKGPSQSQVTVQHNRIETSDAAEQMKAYWAKKIRALEALLAAP